MSNRNGDKLFEGIYHRERDSMVTSFVAIKPYARVIQHAHYMGIVYHNGQAYAVMGKETKIKLPQPDFPDFEPSDDPENENENEVNNENATIGVNQLNNDNQLNNNNQHNNEINDENQLNNENLLNIENQLIGMNSGNVENQDPLINISDLGITDEDLDAYVAADVNASAVGENQNVVGTGLEDWDPDNLRFFQ